ncbi:MAG: hypothetical protein ABH807_00855 [Candidatus Shapirobacteria bacterium]
MINFGLVFSPLLKGNQPLDHIGKKLPTYMRFLELIRQKGWQVYILTRRTYQGGSKFDGGWLFDKGNFVLKKEPIDINLVYDRTGGLFFPPENTPKMAVVNRRDFKVMSCDKYKNYLKIGRFMPPTFWVGSKENLPAVLPKIKTDWVVLKPFNALKGIGIYVGPKSGALDFEFDKKYPMYLAQEFVDTSGGITGLIAGWHDVRVVVVNNQVVWCHMRTPPRGEYLANVARGGSLTEIDYVKHVPQAIKRVVAKIAPYFYKKYDNPIFSLDFGMGKEGPKIFEINDQIGFPLWEMTSRDRFLQALVANFETKLRKKIV